MLYVEGPIGSGKTATLVMETLRILAQHPTASVLVLASNHARQKAITERLLARLEQPMAQLPVYTYAGYVRNLLFNFWPLVEGEICDSLKNSANAPLPRIRPVLSGMEDTELMLKWILARYRGKNPEAFAVFPGSDQGLIMQLVRRIRLRSENRLTRQEMTQRSALLGEICQQETTDLERLFDWTSYAIRNLDANKQLDVFHRLIESSPVVRNWLTANIRHLVVDDVDETIPATQRFIQHLAPTLENLVLAADLDGGSRRGYLNAYPYDWEGLKLLRPGKTVRLERTDAAHEAGQTLLENWRRTEGFAVLPAMVTLDDVAVTRVEMLERLTDDLLALLQQGYTAGDIALVLPKADFLSFYQLQSRLRKRGIPVQLLSGTKRPSDNPLCRAYIHLLQLSNSVRWQYRLSPWELKTIFIQALRLQGLPRQQMDAWVQAVVDCQALQAQGPLLQTAEILPELADLAIELPSVAQERYQVLRQWLEAAKNQPFERQIYTAYADVLARFATDRDNLADLQRIMQSYARQQAIFSDMIRLGGGDFLQVDGEAGFDFDRWWLGQVKTGRVADTPQMPEDISADAVVIATPQKMIDQEVRRKVQFWLDIGSREWARSDNAPLYNAWVHSAVWDGSEVAFSEDFNEAVIRTRAGHITRTLMLLAGEQVRAYHSELDDLGFNQHGLLKPRLLTQDRAVLNQKPLVRAVLRADQQPILAYRQGTMAITAVPGAGKTFVNVELILELVERGVEPDRILVLTYMDSAAKTLLSRLKAKLAGMTHKLPLVSTIHSLAFRILTENDHALLLGFLPEDVTILDEYGRNEVLADVASRTQPESARNPADWQRAVDRAISHAKMQGVTPEDICAALRKTPQNFRLAEFLPAYELYAQRLHEGGLLDFTDLIVKAVTLLEMHPQLRDKYREQFTYIMEDEAQDSSRLLQRFIALMGGESANLVRTGDTNQSITTTFSSAEPAVFRDFIAGAERVIRMDCSGRCASEIVALANDWIREAGQVANLENAFQPVMMQPVVGQNPELLYPLEARLFDLDKEEESWLVRTIQAVRAQNPMASVAVLARSNSQVTYLTGLLHQAGVPAVSLSEQLNISPVFSVLLAYLKLLETPGDLDAQARLYKSMVDARLMAFSEDEFALLQTTPIFYQEPGAIAGERFRQWYYDWLDFSRDAVGGNISALLIRMTDQLFTTVEDRSNGYLTAIHAQEILNQHTDLEHLSPLEVIVSQFEAFRRSWRGKKCFSEVLGSSPHAFVQVMSMHKAKGQEFDVVLLPGLQADSFPHQSEQIRLDESDKLVQALDQVRAGGALPESYQDDGKRAKIEEEARLIYVGLTRARKALYLSAHRQALTRYNKLRKTEPALAFRLLAPKMRYITPESLDEVVEVLPRKDEEVALG